MKVFCRTNLDLRDESWPTEMFEIPRVGDHIRSSTVHRGGFQLELRVCRVTWAFTPGVGGVSIWQPEIELHMTEFHAGLPAKREGAAKGSIVAFYEWYAPLVGSSVGAFI